MRPTRPPARLGAATDRRRPRHGEGRAQADARGGALSPGEPLAVHNDRGVHYRTASWIARCEPHGLRRSMSRKGMSCDNARAEGFFGLLKQEFYSTPATGAGFNLCKDKLTHPHILPQLSQVQKGV